MGLIFEICVGIIRAFAFVTGSTYEEANTYLFIYLQPALLVLSALFVFGASAILLYRYFSWKHFVLFSFFGMSLLGHVMMAGMVWQHYMPYSTHDACVQAYKDLAMMGEATGLGYIGINLFLFIMFFLFVFCSNLIMGVLLWQKRKTI